MHLSEYMQLRGLGDSDVAAETHLSRPTISRIRRGKVAPSWDTIALLKKWSGGKITADDLAPCEAAE